MYVTLYILPCLYVSSNYQKQISRHSSSEPNRGRGSRGSGKRWFYRDTPTPDPSGVGSQSSLSVSTYAVPFTPLYPQSSHLLVFVPMPQFQQPFPFMPYHMGYTIVPPLSHPPETAPQSVPCHGSTFHPLRGSYPYTFMPTPHAHHSITFLMQNDEPTPSDQVNTYRADHRVELSCNQNYDQWVSYIYYF